MDIGNKLFSLIGLAFLKALAYQVLYALEIIFVFLTEIHFGSHKELSPENNLVLVRQLKSGFVSMLVVRYRLVAAF